MNIQSGGVSSQTSVLTIIATQEFVVPRSIPMISPASLLFQRFKMLSPEGSTRLAFALFELSPTTFDEAFAAIVFERLKPSCRKLDMVYFHCFLCKICEWM